MIGELSWSMRKDCDKNEKKIISLYLFMVTLNRNSSHFTRVLFRFDILYLASMVHHKWKYFNQL